MGMAVFFVSRAKAAGLPNAGLKDPALGCLTQEKVQSRLCTAAF
jgi:hypothetical protein